MQMAQIPGESAGRYARRSALSAGHAAPAQNVKQPVQRPGGGLCVLQYVCTWFTAAWRPPSLGLNDLPPPLPLWSDPCFFQSSTPLGKTNDDPSTLLLGTAHHLPEPFVGPT